MDLSRKGLLSCFFTAAAPNGAAATAGAGAAVRGVSLVKTPVG